MRSARQLHSRLLSRHLVVLDILTNYPSKPSGYLRYESLIQANPNVKPMAVRALFDSMALGINKNQIAPQVAMQVSQFCVFGVACLSTEGCFQSTLFFIYSG